MTVRRPLQRQLLAAWRRSIEGDYRNQRINSERSLQASFWAQLNVILPPKRRRMFIEPGLSVGEPGELQRLYPDIVICNTRAVIAVVELKYLPRAKPDFAKDILALRTIAENKQELTVENRRFRGKNADPRAYPFADTVLYVWAGVYKPVARCPDDDEVPLFSEGIRQLRGCFLQLHAETNEQDLPHVFARTG